MEVSLPFRCQAEAPELTENGYISAVPRLRFAQAKALNPRKVLIRVDLLVDVTAYEPKEIILNDSVSKPEDDSICQKYYNGSYYQSLSVQDKPFTFTDQIRLQTAPGDAGQILTCQARAICAESNLIGNKLIFKGNAELSFLLQNSDGSLSPAHEVLPFSQIMEIPGGGEQSDCQVQTEVTGIHYEPANNDGKDYEITLDLLAQAEVCCHRPITMLQDLYSTKCHMDVDRKQQNVRLFCDQFVRSQSVREMFDAQTMVRCILDSRFSMGNLTVQREGQEFLLTQEVMLSVLYLDENECTKCMHQTLAVTCRVPAEDRIICSCRCYIPGDLYVSPAAGGLEVRFTAEFHCTYTSECTVDMVTSAKMGESREKDHEKRPSIVLRLATPDEELWSLAKAYGTTTDQIMQANELDSGELTESRMLLIPSSAK